MKHKTPIFAVILCLWGCTGPSQPPQVVDPPAEELGVSLGLIHAFSEGVQSSFVITRDSETIQVDSFVANIAAVELHLCERTSWGFPGVSEARAHVSASTTRLGISYAEDLLRTPGSARIIGQISPPDGSYCRVEVVYAPADADIVNLTSVSTEQLLGHSVYIAGVRTLPDGTKAPFEWTSDAPVVGILELAGDPGHQVLIHKTVAKDWFMVGEGSEVLDEMAESLSLWAD